MKWYLAIYTGYDYWIILDSIMPIQAKSKKQARKIARKMARPSQSIELYGPFKNQPKDIYR